MAYFTGEDFDDSDQITSQKLDAITTNLRLASDSADGTTIIITAGVAAVGVLSSSNLGANSVTTNAVADFNITAAKLATDAVETAKIKDAAVTNAKLLDGTILFVKLGSAALAAQADMQSETASKLAAAATMKYHPGIPKAYGNVSLAAGTTTITGGYNVTSATDTGSGRQITLGVTMANTNYLVVVTYKDTGAVANSVAYNIDSTTQFTLQAGAEATGRSVSFIVYGQLA